VRIDDEKNWPHSTEVSSSKATSSGKRLFRGSKPCFQTGGGGGWGGGIATKGMGLRKATGEGGKFYFGGESVLWGEGHPGDGQEGGDPCFE